MTMVRSDPLPTSPRRGLRSWTRTRFERRPRTAGFTDGSCRKPVIWPRDGSTMSSAPPADALLSSAPAAPHAHYLQRRFDFVASYNEISDHVGKSSQRLVGCWPCSEAYLTSSYFAQHKSLFDSDCHGYLAEEFGSSDFCKGMASEISLLQLSDLQRQLHVIIERLPIGVFADSFELQHLVHRKVFLDAAVFGDTNLELPSALSNRSIVEIHMNIGHENPLTGYETVLELPLHARYPPLDESGYVEVQFGHPDLFLHCRSKEAQSEPCLCTPAEANVGPAKAVMWRVPSGNDAHRGIVSSVTFVSALVCALSIVVSAITSRNKYVRRSR
ncbi:PIG-X / PBN1 [Musa troglodytarum]|uniref:PIG-X / PBN1 n=1 Tax=Musa troglodytarum TaxID=320322 RepID=A0A9E7K8T8_9LILI|nr:PIG-X / PBN1 [Musa troglodytarum]